MTTRTHCASCGGIDRETTWASGMVVHLSIWGILADADEHAERFKCADYRPIVTVTP